MEISAKKGDIYTYRDYLKFPQDERWEIMEDIPFKRAAAPSRIHQKVLMVIANIFYNFLRNGPCEVYVAPFDVRLSETFEKDEDVLTVVQPDISVICDKTKLDSRGCKGSPDLIVEIVSPSSASMDYIKKLWLYERYKVKEYWIADPMDGIVMAYRLNESGDYEKPAIYREGSIKAGIFDFSVDLRDIFGDMEKGY